MRQRTLKDLIIFLKKLESSKIAYTLNRYRDNAVMIIVSVPGQRWEIEFMEEGTIEIEKFLSNGEMYDDSALEDLFKLFTD